MQSFAERYHIESLIGEGGFGRVYRAHHVGLGRSTAIKILDVAHAIGDIHRRFVREARAAARLDHPGSVRVFDHGLTDDGLPFLAMEFLEGPTLAGAMHSGAFRTEASAVGTVREILAALGHAHDLGVIHRDVKPGNVILAQRVTGRRPVLIDFGLARLRDDDAVTAAGLCVGSPSYVAPERLLGRPADARSDLYSVGVMLYEMIAGVRPFRGDTVEHLARGHLYVTPTPLRELVQVSRSTDEVVRRALSKDPKERFATADEMMRALGAPAPMLQDRQARRPSANDDETTAITIRVPWEPSPSLVRRMWARLRFGAWRWARACAHDGRM